MRSYQLPEKSVIFNETNLIHLMATQGSKLTSSEKGQLSR